MVALSTHQPPALLALLLRAMLLRLASPEAGLMVRLVGMGACRRPRGMMDQGTIEGSTWKLIPWENYYHGEFDAMGLRDGCCNITFGFEDAGVEDWLVWDEMALNIPAHHAGMLCCGWSSSGIGDSKRVT